MGWGDPAIFWSPVTPWLNHKGCCGAGLLRKKAMAAGHVTMEATLPAQQNSQERETVVRLQQVSRRHFAT